MVPTPEHSIQLKQSLYPYSSNPMLALTFALLGLRGRAFETVNIAQADRFYHPSKSATISITGQKKEYSVTKTMKIHRFSCHKHV